MMIKLNYPQFWQSKTIISYLLLPLSMIYWLFGVIRHLIIKPIKLPGKVICVGNITVGGTAKTQLIKTLAQHLTKQNIPFVIVVRSYKANLQAACVVDKAMNSDNVGDEALELCEFGTTIATRHFSDGFEIIQNQQPKIILVDDGMQNPRFLKDIQILMIDGKRKFGNGMLIPAGPMRQSIVNCKVDIAVIVDNKEYQPINIDTPIYHANVIASEQNNPAEVDKKYLAFAGISNPAKFFTTLAQSGYNVQQTATFPDHHQYSPEEINDLIQQGENNQLQLITTQKDIVKLNKYHNQIQALKVELKIDKGFFNQITKLL